MKCQWCEKDFSDEFLMNLPLVRWASHSVLFSEKGRMHLFSSSDFPPELKEKLSQKPLDDPLREKERVEKALQSWGIEIEEAE